MADQSLHFAEARQFHLLSVECSKHSFIELSSDDQSLFGGNDFAGRWYRCQRTVERQREVLVAGTLCRRAPELVRQGKAIERSRRLRSTQQISRYRSFAGDGAHLAVMYCALSHRR